ncbi:MAG: HEPN-associated N-terminal domain-containing protein [Candidatus Methylumidiphilus sp.]
MGRAKEEMMEAEERGWNRPNGFVCPDCVEDEFLKEIIRENACVIKCDYCGGRTCKYSAAPVSEIMEPIANAVFYYFNDPINSMIPFDHEEDSYLLDTTDTRDVLEQLSLDCNEQLFEEIVEAFIHNEWVEAAGGVWSGSHPHEIMSFMWDRFADIVKHEIRYFFGNSKEELNDEEYTPSNLLPTIGNLVLRHNLISVLPKDSLLFRARPRQIGENWHLNEDELGAPPPEKASSGRMNPAGISYLYLAYTQETSLAEIENDSTQQAAIGKFEVSKDLHILDLSKLPALPSMFDDYSREEREELIFLEKFVSEIKKPVNKNGNEHIEYVPSQIVSEYFALIFQANGKKIDGILYPSAVHKGGKNLVLFPNERGNSPRFDQVKLIDAWIYS